VENFLKKMRNIRFLKNQSFPQGIIKKNVSRKMNFSLDNNPYFTQIFRLV